MDVSHSISSKWKAEKGKSSSKETKCFQTRYNTQWDGKKDTQKVQEGNRESEIKKKEKQQREVIIRRDIQNNNTMKGNGKNSDLDRDKLNFKEKRMGWIDRQERTG